PPLSSLLLPLARRDLHSFPTRRSSDLENLELALENALVGAEHLLLVFFQRRRDEAFAARDRLLAVVVGGHRVQVRLRDLDVVAEDRKSTRLNSSHVAISYAVFCLKKKK